MFSKCIKAIVVLLFLYIVIFLFFKTQEECIWNCSPNKHNELVFGQHQITKASGQPFPKQDILDQHIKYPFDILIIFTKANNNFILQYNLRKFLKSLLKHSSNQLRLHVITDDKSLSVASKIIKDVMMVNAVNPRNLECVYISTTLLAEDVKPQVELLQQYFTVNSNSYYKDFLFFFSIFVHKLLPGVTNLIMLDIDMIIREDIALLHNHFDQFSEDHIIGISHELSPIYYSLLAVYRKKHPKTKFGQAHSEGGFPGFNSGVLLIKVDRLAKSNIFYSYLTNKTLQEKTTKYNFLGYLGDQDLFTLMAFDYSNLFYTIPCRWNRQRCEWWRSKVKPQFFEKYFYCEGPTKIAHGNCKSNIPEYGD